MSTELLDAANNLRDFKLAVEYKYLIANAPGGVYLMPQKDCVRKFDGVIFVRRGIYRDGVFRFILDLPEQYNCNDAYPTVTFTPPIFHPLIHPKSGRLNLKADQSMRNGWFADKHFLITVLLHVKKIFYLTDFTELDKEDLIENDPALDLFNKQVAQLAERVRDNIPVTPEDECFTTHVQEQFVKKLNDNIYQSHEFAQSGIIFTPHHAAIDNVRNKILK